MTQPIVHAHAWMPSSPCSDGCLPKNPPTVRRIVLVLRVALALTAFGLLPVLVVLGVPFPRVRRSLTRLGSRMLLLAIGIDLTVLDARSDRERSRTSGGALHVSGHISWTDVIVLTAVRPSTFVARADLVDWPVLGRLARAMKVLPIDRARLHQLPGVVEQVADRVREGGSVVVFPEATTWCGRAYGSLRPALLQAAIDSETWVQPIRLRYLDRTGEQTTATCFVGDETIGASIGRIFRLRGLRAEVEFTAPEAPGSDRRDLARRCEVAIRRDDVYDPTVHQVTVREVVAEAERRPSAPTVAAA
ncbi:lysophospholipid acyltransferase family protein [Rhodococcus sp. IEGM1428]|uniref:lysophospholipid acyltransferase family protein n=1 Tax=Rhodococcus sp. IEGM1428 TaxID=3392191 RepID=UPI003D129CAE